MDQIPAAMDRHLDVIQCRKDGGILLGASGLTGRYWLGSLWFYSNPDVAPDVEKCTAGVQLEAGFKEAVWLDDTKVLVGLDTGGVALWELVDNFHTFVHLSGAVEHDDIVTSVGVVSGGKKAVSAGADRCVKVWDLENMYSTNTYRAHADVVECVSCHPTDSALFLSCSADGSVFLWDTRKSRPVSDIDTSPLKHSPKQVVWQPDSHHFAVGGECGQLVVKDTRKAVGATLSLDCHSRAVTKLSFCKENPGLLASASEDGTAVVLSIDKESGRQIFQDSSHTDFVTGLSWQGGDNLFTCSWDSKVKRHCVSKCEQTSEDTVVVRMETDCIEKENVKKKMASISLVCNGNGAEVEST
ncbi:methylosome protein 50-like isoform X2 [Ostrea edulis]|uniref:methylosome protein 50-like isoform X2 n=1 Tax=Ostrea edulis TaxID=37623 RepID=UPI0024AEE291|nr:methylosome protein 50-like isoform X2 [Ostrea edulis]